MGTDTGRWVEIGDGVLARRYAELDLTVGLVLGGERALVVDTGGDVRQGAELAAAVRAVTALPVEVVLTHAHFDHCFGTAAFLPCPVHAHPGCRAAITATADAQRAEWVAHYRDRGDLGTAAALAATRPPLPDRRVDAAARLDLGGRAVELRHLGRGHTDHDLVVHVPNSDVVFAGDLLEQGAPPDFGDAFPQDWPDTVTALLALGPRAVVPGHGDPMSTDAATAQRDALAVVGALHAAVEAGELDAETAERRSPYPGVRWPGVPEGATHPPEKGDSRGDGGVVIIYRGGVTFSAELRASTSQVWEAAVGHRFVDELWRGALPRDVLARYLVQDYQFLDSFVALLGATVAAADRAEPRITHARQLGLVAGPENDYFDRSLDALEVPQTERRQPELLPPTAGFLALMDGARASADYASCLAVLLVAEWLYLDWATRPDAEPPTEPIQREWIELHRGREFEAWVRFLTDEFDRVTAELDEAHRAAVADLFGRAVDLERRFFESAYTG